MGRGVPRGSAGVEVGRIGGVEPGSQPPTAREGRIEGSNQTNGLRSVCAVVQA
jgi:hypothetical protein